MNFQPGRYRPLRDCCRYDASASAACRVSDAYWDPGEHGLAMRLRGRPIPVGDQTSPATITSPAVISAAEAPCLLTAIRCRLGQPAEQTD